MERCADDRQPQRVTGSPPAGTGNGPAVSREEFDAVFETVRTWGRWARAGRGAWNRVTPDHVRRATALVRSGTTVPLGRPWNTVPGPDNSRPALHYMSDLGDIEPPEPSTHKDFLAVDYHGKAVSHLDALSHVAYRGSSTTAARHTNGSMPAGPASVPSRRWAPS